jgi:hypothetical protein
MHSISEADQLWRSSITDECRARNPSRSTFAFPDRINGGSRESRRRTVLLQFAPQPNQSRLLLGQASLIMREPVLYKIKR